MTTSTTVSPPTFSRALRRLYFIRAAFTVVWAVLLVIAAMNAGPLLTVLLVIYPLFDAGAVLWQLRADPAKDRSSASEWVNIIVSVLVAIALGVASTFSTSAALIVWGIWAVGAGIPQLISAIRNRRTGGQVPQMLSGGISVFAGTSFVIQGLQGAQGIVGVAGYATLGAIFFLVSAIRLSSIIRKDVR
ncbi:uncharacterized membrane protein HdeD (DUF308 family) [Microbacterium sp. W4I4]|uniref:hypothetical protein n=1 Tax=Microbacterium sp. W4I4 TaxID=3042295 RepID=UPI0027834C51|nr:hypothetical protein [Microbacterium sp. W4I4]MDQ0615374.1 uncharacterized membrane protein HdeD (DUF308 family) [Microbacterium sp. W4I4]